MIQSVLSNNLSNNINFKGQVTPIDKRYTAKMAVSDLDKEEQEIYLEELDTFVKKLKEATDDDVHLAYSTNYRDWHVGNAMNYGKELLLTISDVNANGKLVYEKGLPVTNLKGEMWCKGEKFRYDVANFFDRAFDSIKSKYMLSKAIERMHSQEEKSKGSLLKHYNA